MFRQRGRLYGIHTRETHVLVAAHASSCLLELEGQPVVETRRPCGSLLPPWPNGTDCSFSLMVQINVVARPFMDAV